MNRTAGSPPRRRRRFGAGSTATRDSPDANKTYAFNYARDLVELRRFEEAKALLRKTMPVAQRVLGESHDLTITMKWHYSWALCEDTAATLDDLREALSTLEDTERTARRVLGGAHPEAVAIEAPLRAAQAALHARELQPS